MCVLFLCSLCDKKTKYFHTMLNKRLGSPNWPFIYRKTFSDKTVNLNLQQIRKSGRFQKSGGFWAKTVKYSWFPPKSVGIVEGCTLTFLRVSTICSKFVDISENTVKFLLSDLAELTKRIFSEALMNVVLSYDKSYWSERISQNFLICIMPNERPLPGMLFL